MSALIVSLARVGLHDRFETDQTGPPATRTFDCVRHEPGESYPKLCRGLIGVEISHRDRSSLLASADLICPRHGHSFRRLASTCDASQSNHTPLEGVGGGSCAPPSEPTALAGGLNMGRAIVRHLLRGVHARLHWTFPHRAIIARSPSASRSSLCRSPRPTQERLIVHPADAGLPSTLSVRRVGGVLMGLTMKGGSRRYNPRRRGPMGRMAVTVGTVCVFAATVAAQQPSLRFEVASVKRNTSTPPRTISSPRFQGTTFTASNVAVEMLITTAYGVPSRDVMDSPGWVLFDFNGGERYDVTAKFAEGTSAQDQRAMLRSLMEDRFALRVHRETRQLPVYLLTRLDDRELGPKLKPAAKNCQPRTACEGRTGSGFSSYTGADWAIVSQQIGSAVGERMLDRTGLSGFFDFELTYTTRGLSVTGGDAGLDVYGAVRQQLGLKLELDRAPFEVLVIESIQRPTPD